VQNENRKSEFVKTMTEEELRQAAEEYEELSKTLVIPDNAILWDVARAHFVGQPSEFLMFAALLVFQEPYTSLCKNEEKGEKRSSTTR
jgi:hypothetical protein